MEWDDELFGEVLAEQRAMEGRNPSRETYRTRVRQAYNVLIRQAKKQEPIYYGELMAEIGTDRGYIGSVVGGVSRMELKQGRPPLSALVLQKQSDEPGKGFCENLLADFGRWKPGEDRHAAWERELQSVYETWDGTSKGERDRF